MSNPNLLHAALCSLSSASISLPPSYSPTCSPARLADNHFHHIISDATLALFNALSPYATTAALKELDTQARVATHGDFSSNSAPHLLGRLVHLVSCQGNIAATVGEASHIVLLSSLHYSQEGTVQVQEEDASTSSAACSCNAYTYRSGGEALCKHIIITAVAALSGLSPIEIISADQFVKFVKPDNT